MSEPRLIHYSPMPITKLVPVPQNPRAATMPMFKPEGVWFSTDNSWAQYIDTILQFRKRGNYCYEAKLRPDSRILRIATADEMLAFTDEFNSRNLLLPHVEWQDFFDQMRMGINWFEVGKRWPGIMIHPMIWSQRLDPATGWYYAWDCACACIWDTSIIERFEQVPDPYPSFAEALDDEE